MSDLKSTLDKLKANPPGQPTRPTKPHSDADPSCQKCGGLGYIPGNAFPGRWFVCHCVIETRDRTVAAMLPKPDMSKIGLTVDELALTWATIRPEISDVDKAVAVVRPAFERGYGLIFMHGAWGQGKTILGKVLVAESRRMARRAAYGNLNDILDNIRMSFDADQQSTELARRVGYWTGLDVLFIDEMDKANPTAWAASQMFKLIDARYQRALREEALTVIASNADDGELDGYLKSRLHDRRVGESVYLNGPDARRVMPDGYKF